MHQTLPLVSSSVKNSQMDDIQSPSTPALSSLQKRITTSTTRKWQLLSMGSNVVAHISLVLITRLWSTQTIKTYNTFANHKKSWAIKPNGWNSSKTLTTASITSLDTLTP